MIEVALHHEYHDLPIDVEFAASARCVALFGDSGAGKTTVLNAIAGLVRPQSGRIVLDGQVLFDHASGVDVAPAAREVGYVFQDGRLFPHLSVRANLLYGAHARRRPVAGLDRIVDLLDLGSLLGRRPLDLSGGERQRVAIGRALLSQPRVLLLDEPLTGLHREARVQVLEHLRRLKQELGIATLLVSHQPDEVAALADEVVLMRAGRTVARLDVAAFVASQPPVRNGIPA
ncbi:MAG: ATP-binding cassette domain-containing protein [Dokdonella sp.]